MPTNIYLYVFLTKSRRLFIFSPMLQDSSRDMTWWVRGGERARMSEGLYHLFKQGAAITLLC